MIDRILSVYAAVQAVLVTLQAGSRLIRLERVSLEEQFVLKMRAKATAQSSSGNLLDLPLIRAPANPTTERSFLFDLTVSFRESVRLGLQLDKYANATSFQVITESVENDLRSSDVAVETEAYRMSLIPAFLPQQKHTAPKLPTTRAAQETMGFEVTEATDLPKQARSQLEESSLDCDVRWQTDFVMVNSTAATTGGTAVGNAVKPSVRIRAYAPATFTTLRSYFGLDAAAYRRSMLESGPFCSFQSNSKGAARVGGSFFFTQNGEYMIKTVKPDEIRTLLQILPKYQKYMKEHGKLSLLNRFCGLYEVGRLRSEGSKEEEQPPQYLVVMNSVFPGGVPVAERFDLKGSTLGRKASVEERASLGNKAVLKDLDLAEEFLSSSATTATTLSLTPRAAAAMAIAIPSGADSVASAATSDSVLASAAGFHIGPVAKAEFLSQLRMDVEFLRDCSVIDYSLLVGVSPTQTSTSDDAQPEWNLITALSSCFCDVLRPLQIAWSSTTGAAAAGRRTSMRASPLSVIAGERKGQPAMYFFGVIDFLQPFDYKKDLEYRLKGLIHAKGTYSCVPPELYAQRFLDFIDKHVT